jgi:hypothetical protein
MSPRLAPRAAGKQSPLSRFNVVLLPNQFSGEIPGLRT